MNRRRFLSQTDAAIAAMAVTNELLAADETRMDKMPDYQSAGVKLLTNSNPAADGFHFPTEWELHDHTIMVLPPPQNWKSYGIPLKDVRGQWADVPRQSQGGAASRGPHVQRMENQVPAIQ